MDKKTNYDNKIKLCKKLGAEKFQNIVFFVERLKFKILKRLFPNFLKFYDRMCDRIRDKKLKKLHSQTTKMEIINYYRTQKLLARKEFYQEKNLNYHFDMNRPTEFIKYLNWNKNIHVRGIKQNLIIIPICTLLLSINPIFYIIFIYEIFSLLINFQCVNIQNYNIYRFKEKEEKLRNIEKRKQEKEIKTHSKAARVIANSLKETDEIPTIDNVINNVSTLDEIKQLRDMIQMKLNVQNEKKLQYISNEKNKSNFI